MRKILILGKRSRWCMYMGAGASPRPSCIGKLQGAREAGGA